MTKPTKEDHARGLAWYKQQVASSPTAIDIDEAYAHGIADERARIMRTIEQWFDGGCPELDRSRFVAFGPLGMKSAMREGVLKLMESLNGRTE